MIVIDASALAEFLLDPPRLTGLVAHLRSGQSFAAPHFVDLEVTHVLRRLVLRRQLAAARAEEALDDLMALPLDRYAHQPLLKRVWALRDNLTSYDAAYVALAESLAAELVTADRRIAAASGHGARVTLVTSTH